MKPSIGLALLAGVFAMTVLPGCGGPSMITVNGKLLKNGQPLTIDKSTKVSLSFAPERASPENNNQTYPAIVVPSTVEYKVELPSGKYAVRCVMMNMQTNEPMPTAPPKVLELTRSQTIDIDIGAK